MLTNCPNCGAPVRGSKCEYCGTVLDWGEYKAAERELSEIRRQMCFYRLAISRAELGSLLVEQVAPFRW